jgi:hypothetical protein
MAKVTTPDEGEATTIVNLAEAAMHMYGSAIASLPDPNDADFHQRADVILSGLRKLQVTLTTAAARSRTTPAVTVAVSGVRKVYDDLMVVNAAAPSGTLGQQLYVARRRARLSAQEAANGVGLRADLLDELEAGEIPTDDEALKIKELIEALGGSQEGAQNNTASNDTPSESWDESSGWNDGNG